MPGSRRGTVGRVFRLHALIPNIWKLLLVLLGTKYHARPASGGALVPAVIIFKNNPWHAVVKPLAQRNESVYVPQAPHCPETGKTVCANVHTYPEEQVVHMVQGTRFRYFNFSTVFFDDRENFDEPHIQVWAPPPPPEAPTYSVATLLLLQDEPQYSFEKAPNPWWDLKHYSKTLKRRKRNTNGVEPACETRNLFISPKVALNDKNQWKYIVNAQDRDPRIKQIVRAELCRSLDESCSASISLPFGYTSVCKQKYLKKKLLSLDVDGRGLSEENFFVPSCCVCELVRTS